MNTEGAIAKYMATEAGNAAADAAIQAHGGYGYTRPYVVEKIRRDVRITTIYEGTSEIMEMTIARDRWQDHLQTQWRVLREDGPGARSGCTARTDVGARAAPGVRALEGDHRARLRTGSPQPARPVPPGRDDDARRGWRRPSRASPRAAPDHGALSRRRSGAARASAREAAMDIAGEAMRWCAAARAADAPDLRRRSAPAIFASARGMVADLTGGPRDQRADAGAGRRSVLFELQSSRRNSNGSSRGIPAERARAVGVGAVLPTP
jgi:hypothetical protein